MIPSETISGQQRAWSTLKKLGEGDAGEVYLVESLLDKKAAILKRPSRSTFTADALRQAGQIESEGRILAALAGLNLTGRAVCLRTPELLDRSRVGSEFGDKFFIIESRAAGIDLGELARAAHFGQAALNGRDPAEQMVLESVTRRGEVPPLLLLRALAGLLELLDRIHGLRVADGGLDQAGILWNDVKPEHLFWDPRQGCFTVIDWGNACFLEADGASKDRRSSVVDDYYQFITHLGRFLSEACPALHTRLDWPQEISPGSAYTEGVKQLRDRIGLALAEELDGLRQVRQEESSLIHSGGAGLEDLRELEAIQERIQAYGELPDTTGASRFYGGLALDLANRGEREAFASLCAYAAGKPGMEPQKWSALTWLATSPLSATSYALVAGVSDDWATVLWEVLAAARGAPDLALWDELSSLARRQQLQAGGEALTPYVTVNRTLHQLQAQRQKLDGPNGDGNDADDARLIYDTLVPSLKEEVAHQWRDLEPDPPNSDLEYGEIECLLEDIASLAPAAKEALDRVLDQPRAQVQIVMDAWGRKEFETARRGLRRILLWDPDRWRVLLADRALQEAPAWLDRVRNGPPKGEPLPEFLTRLELEGRDLRNHIGPTRWLDTILDAFARLRRGASPADLILEKPELLNEAPWLNEFEAPRIYLSSRSGPVRLERDPAPAPEGLLRGVREGAIGQELTLLDSLDTWAPEARGSSARVFSGRLRAEGNQARTAAVKVMRPGRHEYAVPLFREEVQVLTLMRDVPGMTPMLECGFLKPDGDLPPDDRAATSAELIDLKGSVLRFAPSEVPSFLAALSGRVDSGWLPYLVMEKRSREDNLMMFCDLGITGGRFLPLRESLQMAIQICEIMQAAHARNIVYRDHKILHYYWLEAYNGVFVIDWNVAKMHPQGLSQAEKQFDVVQFGARAMHHLLTGRPAPGALPLGPNRPEEIEAASQSYRVQWTYDDQRLPSVIRDLLERVLAGEHSSFRDLREALLQVYQQLPDTPL